LVGGSSASGNLRKAQAHAIPRSQPLPAGRRRLPVLFQLLRGNQSDHQKYEEQSDAYEEQHLGDFRRADGDTGKSQESRDDGDYEKDQCPFQHVQAPQMIPCGVTRADDGISRSTPHRIRKR
jgi:hypothetical protein